MFVSGTRLDLNAHCRLTARRLLRLGFVVETMEDWPADPSAPDAVSVGRVEGCDLLVLLVARRRGHIPPGAELSITQQEYERANELHIDRLVFLLDDRAPWIREHDERDTDPAISRWRQHLRTEHVVGFFDEKPESVEIEAAVVRWMRQRGRVRGEMSSIADDGSAGTGSVHAVRVAPGDERALDALIGAFRRGSLASDFAERDFEALEIAALELFRNAAGKVPSSQSELSVSLTVENIIGFGPPSPGIVFELTDYGPGFDFDATVERLELELRDTGKEHGLLQAARKGTVVAQASTNPHTMGWMKLRSPAMPEPTFNDTVVVPLIYSWSDRAVRIWNDLYTLGEVATHLARSDAFVDLVFDPLIRADRAVVGVEVVGKHGTIPAGADPVEALLVSLLRFKDRERFFTKELALFADTEPSDHRKLREFCAKHAIALFEDPQRARAFAP